MPSESERVADDPLLLARARRAYGGRGDLLDQLWWLDHPGSTAPSGAEDPIAALDRERRGLYRPGGPDGGAERIERMRSAVDADRTAALAAVRATLSSALPPRAASAPPPQEETADPPLERPRRRSRRLAVVALLAALAAGAGIGVLVGRSSTSPSAAALAVFGRAQRADDRPDRTALPSSIASSSTRLLGTSNTTGLRVYGARSRSGEVCLLGVVLATRSLAACTSEAGFAAGGLRMAFRASVDPEGDELASPDREISPHWYPDGRFSF